MWYLIVSIPDLCNLTYFADTSLGYKNILVYIPPTWRIWAGIKMVHESVHLSLMFSHSKKLDQIKSIFLTDTSAIGVCKSTYIFVPQHASKMHLYIDISVKLSSPTKQEQIKVRKTAKIRKRYNQVQIKPNLLSSLLTQVGCHQTQFMSPSRCSWDRSKVFVCVFICLLC